MSEDAWWRRLAGQPDWMVQRRSRVLGHREVVYYRVLMLVSPILCLAAGWALRLWFLVVFSAFPLFNLFVSLPRHQRRQILGRPPS